MRQFLFLITIACGTLGASADLLRGRIEEASTAEPVDFATIVAKPSDAYAVADEDGRWQMNLPEGDYELIVSFVGFDTDTIPVSVPHTEPIDIVMRQTAVTLREVVITAKEGDGMTSASRIDRDAMQHLQPTSFADLLELLPGQMSKTPDMGKANTITLREVGGMSATGARTDLGDDYAITSLGTSFMVDGAPINSDANLQGLPTSSAADPDGVRNLTNRGVDMRSLSTDNIESVEIIRGIPSAEYGNLSSGMVNIRRIRRATPFTARFKADEYSKLFSAGKGFAIGKQVVNADLGYLDSRSDPRDPRENYKRLTASLRGNLVFGAPESSIGQQLLLGADYTGSFDNVKVDPDLNYNKIDEYVSKYNRWAFTTDYTLIPRSLGWIESLGMNGSVSYELDRLSRRKQVAPARASIAPTTMQEGVHDGKYLLGEYIAEYINDGKPLSVYLKLKSNGEVMTGRQVTHSWKAGVDWQLAKNFGRGQVYDLERPLSASWTTRPRAFSEIPALNVVSGYAEDNLSLLLGASSLSMQVGARIIGLAGLDHRYLLAGKPYVDPRLNGVYNFPTVKVGGRDWRFLIAGGYGLTTRMPTVDYLFPQLQYLDLVQLNYYDVNNPAELSRVNLRTYIADPTNYDLRPARNRKWEVRLGLDFGGNSLSVTFFDEHMSDGFRHSNIYAPYAVRRYDASAVVPGSLTAPPALETMPFTDMMILNGFRQATNGSRIDKRGVEYQLATVRWPALRTSLIVNGAWLRTRYSNSQMLYSPVSDVVGNTPVSERYVGIYLSDEGRINEQFNTNFTFDTQIPRWGLIFSTSVQCLWYTRTTRLRENGTPLAYISALDGQVHDFSESDADDPMLKYLVKKYNAAAYTPQTIPPAVYVNLKATKQIGKWLRLSAFVNQLIDYLPDYQSNGLTIRRVSDTYFGMEATLTL